MQVICSQMDFTHCRSVTFSKLSVGKEYISKPFFFFFFPGPTLYDEPFRRQFSTSASCFQRLLIPPF